MSDHYRALSRVRCYGCNECGHYKRDCPNLNRGAASYAKVGEDRDENTDAGSVCSRGGSAAGDGWSGWVR